MNTLNRIGRWAKGLRVYVSELARFSRSYWTGEHHLVSSKPVKRVGVLHHDFAILLTATWIRGERGQPGGHR